MIVYWSILTVGLVLLVCVVYLLFVWLLARDEVRHTPRTDMFVCDKHGAFPAKYALQGEAVLFTGGEETKVCPFCLKDAERIARERYGVKK